LKTVDVNKFSFYTRKHPTRNCIYDEANSVLKFKKDSVKNIDFQISEYKKEGFPKNYGLIESAIIIRKHNESKCIILDNKWAS
jgi:hypothetical protein